MNSSVLAPWRGLRHGLIVALPALGLVLLLLFGVAGVMRGGPSHIDMRVFYGAGTWYLDGVSPYGAPRTPPRLMEQGLHMKFYGYPPHFAPFAMGLAALDYAAAKTIYAVANLAAAIALAWLVVALMRDSAGPPPRPAWPTLTEATVAFAILGSPFTAHVVWLGNTTVIVAASLAGAWWLDRRGRPVVAGMLLAIAAIKPQFAVLPVLWLAAERRWATLGAAAAAAAALYAYHAVQFGPIESVRLWLDSLAHYEAGAENTLGYQHLFGLQEFLYALGLTLPRLEPVAIVLGGVAWAFRRHLTALEELAILCVLATLFLPTHDYDLVLLAPLAGALAPHVRASSGMSAVALLATAVLYVPQRALRGFDSALLNHWRVPVVLGLAAWLVALIRRREGRASARAAAPAADRAAR